MISQIDYHDILIEKVN